MFLALRLFDPHGNEITFIGSNDPRVPIGLGWLRASHRNSIRKNRCHIALGIAMTRHGRCSTEASCLAQVSCK